MDFSNNPDKLWDEFFNTRLIPKRKKMWNKIKKAEAKLKSTKDNWGNWINIQMDLEWRKFFKKRTGYKYARN